jgi:hypothetical protein
MSLVPRLVRGALAGAAGTLAMDLVWYRRQQRDGSEQSFLEWELGGSPGSYDEAGPPAQVARTLAGALGIELPESSAGAATNVVHWATGMGYAAVIQAVIGRRRNLAASGLATGVGAFANSYAVLGALGIYQPIWEYDADTLRDDLTAHLVFGAATAVAYRVLARGR